MRSPGMAKKALPLFKEFGVTRMVEAWGDDVPEGIKKTFDRLGIPREKLAYIADSSSAPSSILIPFNAWGAFIMGLLLAQGIEAPFSTMLSAMVYNFYPMLTILMVFLVIISRKDFGPMARAEKRTRETGKLLNDGARPMVSDEITSFEMKEGIRPRAMNMVVPLATMVLMGINRIVVTSGRIKAAMGFRIDTTDTARAEARLRQGESGAFFPGHVQYDQVQVFLFQL